MSAVTRARPDRDTLARAALLANTLVLATLCYVLLTPADLTPARFAFYGLLWVGIGFAVLFRETTVARSASTRARRVATGVAAVYLAVLAVAGGIVVPGGVPAAVANGWFVRVLPPGWGPALVYGGVDVAVVLTPARVVGYLALAALVRGTVLDAAGLRSGVPGLLALFSCVSCSLPILAGAAALLFGAGSALAATTASLSYDLSTLVFLVTVGLLYWRPLARR
ncbi:MAG: hypothetical protein ABEJ43_04405 [Haloferacaceae archaeon]